MGKRAFDDRPTGVNSWTIPLKKVEWCLISPVMPLSLLLVGCDQVFSSENIQGLTTPSIMDPQGYGAYRISILWWIITAIATAVFIVVVSLLVAALLRRRGEDAGEANVVRDRLFIVGGGIVVPLAILAAVYFLTLTTMAALANTPVSEEIVIKVVGYQWWWEVEYPLQNFKTANEIHIPAGIPIRIEVEAADVIHSFWVPELHGKIDMIPGQTNVINLQADRPGVYYGQCAEFCGIQHAKMAFIVVADTPEQFSEWLSRQRQPASVPTGEQVQQGQQVFRQANCVRCHTIRGTEATGMLGPDLTHLAGRRTLAAGMLANTRGNLGGWIIDPQGIKPGNLMPPSNISGEDLQALIAYLESLK